MVLNSETYVDVAEDVIKKMIKQDRSGNDVIGVTTSKIRNILSMFSELYNDVMHETSEELGKDIVERVQYLRLRIVYEAGRDKNVKEFVMKSNLLNILKSVKRSKKSFLLVCKYMEALVAYHKFYGGKDN